MEIPNKWHNVNNKYVSDEEMEIVRSVIENEIEKIKKRALTGSLSYEEKRDFSILDMFLDVTKYDMSNLEE